MKKTITTILAACMALSMAACSSKPEASDASAAPSAQSEQAAKSAEPKDIEAAIAGAVGDGYLATVEVGTEDLYLTPLADLDMSKFSSYVCKQAVTPSVDADKVVIVKLSDTAYGDEVVKAFNADFQQSVHYIHQYPFGVKKVEGGRIYKTDDLVIYVIAGKSADENAAEDAETKLANDEYAKIDSAIQNQIGTLPANLATYDANSEGSGNEGGDEIPDKPILGG